MMIIGIGNDDNRDWEMMIIGIGNDDNRDWE